MKIKYCRIQFSNGKFKTIKGCKDLLFDEYANRSCVRVHCTDGRIYIFNWNLIQEIKLWEEEEKDEKSGKEVSTKAAGDQGTGSGDRETSEKTDSTPGDDESRRSSGVLRVPYSL